MVWLGATGFTNDMVFRVPEGFEVKESDRQKAARLGYVGSYTRLGNSCWFTNIDHGRRHTPLDLMTMEDNIMYSKHKEIKGVGYKKYDNYEAIDVPFTDAIPVDYKGIMGVPITFVDKYCPEQFEIIWRGGDIDWAEKECNFYTPPSIEQADKYKKKDKTWRIQNPYLVNEYGAQVVYQRIFIRKRKQQ